MRIIRTIFFFFLIIVALTTVSVLIAKATSKDDIAYPVPELGNCADETACRTYCDNPDHLPECLRFAKRHNLLEGKDIPEENVEKLIDALKGGGPGGCKNQRQCEEFCDDVKNINACVDFAEKSGFLTGEKLKEVKKVRTALDRGIKLPPGCKNERTCEAVCEAPPDIATAKSCFGFAKEAGLLPPEFDDAKTERMFELIDRGEINFREMKKCESLDRGENLDASTIDKCLEVGEKLGFMKPEEKELAKRMMLEGGPGGCRGRNCQTICEEKPDECLKYFEEKGIPFPAETQGRIQEGLEQMRSALAGAPPEVLACLKTEIGADVFNRIQSGAVKASEMAGIGPRMGTIMQKCFAQNMMGGGPGAPGDHGVFPGGGPGGLPGSQGVMQECFTEIGFEPTKPPGPDMQQKISACVRRKIEAQGFPGRPDGSEHGFPGGPGPQAGISVSINEGQLGHDIEIRTSQGIKSFSISIPGEPPYGGSLSCPKEYTAQRKLDFPTSIAITTCDDGKEHTIAIPGTGTFSEGGNTRNTQGPPQSFHAKPLPQDHNQPPPFNHSQVPGFDPSKFPGFDPSQIPNIPQGNLPSGFDPAQFQGQQAQPSGSNIDPTQIYNQQIQQQIQNQYQQQYQQQYNQTQQQIQQQYQGGTFPTQFDPAQGTPPPSGNYQDPATQCAQGGGSWDGTKCDFPVPQSSLPSPIEFFAQLLFGFGL